MGNIISCQSYFHDVKVGIELSCHQYWLFKNYWASCTRVWRKNRCLGWKIVVSIMLILLRFPYPPSTCFFIVKFLASAVYTLDKSKKTLLNYLLHWKSMTFCSEFVWNRYWKILLPILNIRHSNFYGANCILYLYQPATSRLVCLSYEYLSKYTQTHHIYFCILEPCKR